MQLESVPGGGYTGMSIYGAASTGEIKVSSHGGDFGMFMGAHAAGRSSDSKVGNCVLYFHPLPPELAARKAFSGHINMLSSCPSLPLCR